MKRLLLLGFCLWVVVLVRGQQLTYDFDYDSAGNRVRRTVIRLNDRCFDEEKTDDPSGPLTEMTNNGLTVAIFPNPTKESVRFELTEGNQIGNYVLSDINGRTIGKGYCGNPSLTLDLSDQNEGIYLLEIFMDRKSHVYKIIKQ